MIYLSNPNIVKTRGSNSMKKKTRIQTKLVRFKSIKNKK